MTASADEQDNPPNKMCSLFVDHDCGIEMPASPVYPKELEAGEADCSVKYHVEEDGSVEVLKAVCSDKRFVDSAIQGMSGMRYQTKDICGRTCPTIGQTFEYPLLYRMK